MSGGAGTRFKKGKSGNPAGRPRKKREPVQSAFDVILDQVLTVNQGGVERQLTVDEALELQTYQAALKGSRMAVRKVLKMIEKREKAIAEKASRRTPPLTVKHSRNSDNAAEALKILNIAAIDPASSAGAPESQPLHLTTWAVQAALSRPGRRAIPQKDVEEIKHYTIDSDKLVWPRRKIADD
jgi:hypothetical protein